MPGGPCAYGHEKSGLSRKPDTGCSGGFTCIPRFILTMDPQSCYSPGTCQGHPASLHQCLAPFRLLSMTLL